MQRLYRWFSRVGIVALFAASITAVAGPTSSVAARVARGKYLVRIGSCNDCHSPGYGQHGGNTPKAELLTGNGEVFVGPWGTSFPTNLRLLVAGMSRDEWIHAARTVKARPPMPWYALRAMTDDDLTAIYAYIKALGPAGKPAPEALPPGKLPPPPYMQLVLPSPPSAAKPAK